ncbi:MAG: hypothetical protein ABF289_18195 [Clostridiales bacterium]
MNEVFAWLYLCLLIIIGGAITIFLWYIYQRITKIKKAFDSLDQSILEQTDVLKDIEEKEDSVKKTQKNILEMNIEFSRKIRLILSKYKGEEFDTRVLKSLSDEIDYELTNRSDETETSSVNDEPEFCSDLEYKSIELLENSSAEMFKNIIPDEYANKEVNNKTKDNISDFGKFKLQDVFKKMSKKGGGMK